ncbi:hypothetical protein H1C71_018236 [Ictidomys tridecemlineatus]|nr:hypothetical protein H1C71_018236 [Ictidomys tridecemlineatus]
MTRTVQEDHRTGSWLFRGEAGNEDKLRIVTSRPCEWWPLLSRWVPAGAASSMPIPPFLRASVPVFSEALTAFVRLPSIPYPAHHFFTALTTKAVFGLICWFLVCLFEDRSFVLFAVSGNWSSIASCPSGE